MRQIVGVMGIRLKSKSNFKIWSLASFSLAFRSMNKIQSKFFNFSHFLQFGVLKTPESDFRQEF